MSARELGRAEADALVASWPSSRSADANEGSIRSQEEIDRSYRAERLALQVTRAPLVYGFVLFFAVFATALELLFYPERRSVALLAFAAYAITCIATVVTIVRNPSWAAALSVVGNNLLILLTATYYIPTRAVAEACAMTLVLFLAALPLLNGAGVRVQALTCIGALVSYPLALLGGAVPLLPVVYGLTAVAGASGVTILGAYLFDRQRREAFRGREALRAGEERLRSMLERYRALYENNPVMYFTVAADGAVRSVNRFGAEQLGYEVEELVGRSLPDFFLPEDRADVRGQLQRCVEGLGTVARWECRQVRKDGRVLWVRQSARALREGDGHVVVLIVCEDATERKQAEDAIRRHRADLAHVGRVSLMGEMAAGLAHELNQPLSAIVNFTRGCERRLRAGVGPDEKMLEALGQVSAQALRAGEIVHRIRKFIRKQDPTLSWVDLNDLVRNVTRLADADGSHPGVRVQLALAASMPKIYVDSIQIEQVILNLMRNGFDAMDGEALAEKTLSIRTAAVDDANVDVAISDTGMGLNGDLADRIFDPFFSTKATGLGLGLSISRSIVEAHGGRLWAEPNPGGGSTFHFRLAVRSPRAAIGNG
jgi:PAS domain S-box-containing protein